MADCLKTVMYDQSYYIVSKTFGTMWLFKKGCFKLKVDFMA